MFAIANESIAPNEYIVPRKFTSRSRSTMPGSISRIGKVAEKKTSERQGVRSRGWSFRKNSGICR
jgi:hypothetical protein